MSNGQFGEKTEQATPQRLREARRKGQIVKSTDLSSAISLLAVAFLFILFGNILFQWVEEMVALSLGENLLFVVTDTNLLPLMLQAGSSYFKIMALIFITVLSSGLAINYAQVGFIFSGEKLSPSLEKLNPLEGFKKIASRRAMFELAKAVFKITLVGIIAYGFFMSRFESFLMYMFLAPDSFFTGFSGEVLNLSLRVAVVFLMLALLDYVYQRHEHLKNLRMTKQEVKEEYKQMEGDPLIKGKLRDKQRSIASQRMMQEVPNATVIVTNPTELAVALKYTADDIPIPIVVAKGSGLVAARIREKAKENDVPILENKPVARMLYEQVEIGQVISVDLYQSVAEILALVYEINRERGGRV
ncbi:MAG: flagellar biosynthesis protein FlhB [Firmicutes bacterium]|nr:flagellar biosynthesis protein FlhB [Bacillota bacterium]